MSLFCGTDGDNDGSDWWWYQPDDEAPLATKRSRKCCSCGQKVGVGDTARKIARYRPPTEFEETRGIACDDVPLADWYLCETCGDVADSLSELGFCYTLDESLQQQIADYRREEAADHERMKTHNAPHERAAEGGPLDAVVRRHGLED